MSYELPQLEPEATSDSDSEFEPGGGGRGKGGKRRDIASNFARSTTGRKRGVISYKESSRSDMSEVGEVEEGGCEGVMMAEEDSRDGIERVVQTRTHISEIHTLKFTYITLRMEQYTHTHI